MYRHTIAIGATGMLQAASIALAACSKRFTSIARTSNSLSRLDGALGNSATRHHKLQLDWSDPDDFVGQIEQHVAGTEAPDLVVAWIHDDQLPLRLALKLANNGVAFRFFHILGSAAANPAGTADSVMESFDPPSNLDYHQVILGAQHSGRGFRWLTHQEISQGVLEAIKRKEKRFVVGTLDRYKQ